MIRSSKVILKSNDLDQVISKIKKNKKKISLVSGVFDLLHAGHIKYFKAAKQYADILIVSLTDDKYVNKGLGKPFFKFSYRAEVLLSIKYIDYIVLSKNFHCLEIIQKVKPNFYVKGPDYKNLKSDITKNIIKEKKLTEKLGGKVIFINEETFSSSRLINKANIIFNNDQTKFLKKIKNQYSFLDIKKYLKKFEKKSIYCVGETIIDKYTFCETIGKSGKDPHLVINKIFQETYLGGAAAIARQLFEFGAKVKFLSAIEGSYIAYLVSKRFNKPFLYNLDKNSYESVVIAPPT